MILVRFTFHLYIFKLDRVSDIRFICWVISSLMYHTMNHNQRKIIQESTAKNNLNPTNTDIRISKAHSQSQNFRNNPDSLSFLIFNNLAIHDHNANNHVKKYNHSTNNIKTLKNNKNMLWNFSLFIHICIRLNKYIHANRVNTNFQIENFLLHNTYDTGIAVDMTAHIMSHRFLPNHHHPPANISW